MAFIKELFVIFSTSANWSVDNILSAISIILVIAGGRFTYKQWVAANKTKRMELIEQIMEKLRFDPEMVDTMYTIDYDHEWYGIDFHDREDDLEYRIDKLLSYLSYICYLKKEGNLSKKEFRILRYEINRICTSPCIQAYLWNLHHFSRKLGFECTFQYLIEYAIKNKLIDKSFLREDCELYEKTLNF